MSSLAERYAKSKNAERVKELSEDDQLALLAFGIEKYYRDKEQGRVIEENDDAMLAYMEEIDEAFFLYKKIDVDFEYSHLTDLGTGDQVTFKEFRTE